ncbi:MAG: arginine deiminase [Bacteroidota bacterium]|jgi:N-dimethylarginine dimethylaminohydrolase|nr:arginine deiminase [Bacteroidota bacterium]
MPLNLRIENEFSQLDSVILGIATDTSDPGSNNPKAEFHLDHGTYPGRKDLIHDVNNFEQALIENGIKVFRPQNISKKTQIFTRDIGFVIDDMFFISSMIEGREKEVEGITYLLDLIGPKHITDLSKENNLKIEGGDVVLANGKVFVGLSDRTNTNAFQYLKERFKGKREVIQVEIVTNPHDHRDHSLHLDCVFNPLGNQCAIVYEDGIKNIEDLYENIDIEDTDIFKVNNWQFYAMAPNVLSLGPTKVIIESEFVDLKYWLREKGFTTIEVDYRQISKLGGLFRCSTLPLFRL